MLTIIEFKNIFYEHNNQKIFENFNLCIHKNDTIGILDTKKIQQEILLKLITKETVPIIGQITIHPKLNIIYIDNHFDWDSSEIVIDYLIKESQLDIWELYDYSFKFDFNTQLLTKPISELTYPYQNRLKILTCFLKKPDFIFFLYPLDVMDIETQLIIKHILLEYKKENKGFFIIGENLDFIKKTCSYILELNSQKFQYKKINTQEYKKYSNQKNYSVNTDYSFYKHFLNDLYNKNKLYTFNTILNVFKINKLQESIFNGEITIREDPIHLKNVKLNLKKSEKYAVVGVHGIDPSKFLKIIAGIINLESDNHHQKAKKIGYFFYDYLKDFYLDISVVDYLFSDRLNIHKKYLIEILQISGFNENEWSNNFSNLSREKQIFLILLKTILEKNEVLILEEPTKYILPESKKILIPLLKYFPGTIIFTMSEISYVQQIATKVIEISSSNLQIIDIPFRKYIHKKELELKKIIEESKNQTILLNIQKYIKTPEKKNGHSPLPVKNPNDPVANKKALLLFFDKNYIDRKKEIYKLREELKEMEKIIKELESRRDELWNLIKKYGLNTPENYEKMDRINKKLIEIENKWYELQSRLDELEGF